MLHWRRLIGGAVLGIGVLSTLLLLPSRPGDAKTGKQIIILSTASVRGEVSPCG